MRLPPLQALLFVAAIGTTSACASQPYFVRTSTQRDTDVKFIVSNAEDVFVVRCRWQQPGAPLEDCRRLSIRYDDR